MKTIYENQGVKIMRSSKRSLLIAILVSSMTGVSAFDSEMGVVPGKSLVELNGQNLNSTSLLQIKREFFAFHNTEFIDVQDSLTEINRQALYVNNLSRLRNSNEGERASDYLLPELMVKFADQVSAVKNILDRLDVVGSSVSALDDSLSIYSGDTDFSNSRKGMDDFVLSLSLNEDAMDVLKLYNLDLYKWVIGRESINISYLQRNHIKDGR